MAQEEARALKHNYIGTEHILLGLLREEEGLAARVLESLEITVERVRANVIRLVGSSDEVTSGQIPFTPRAKKTLEHALRESLSLGHNYIGTEHILLGLTRENEGVAIRILHDFDADPEKIRNEVLRMLSGPGAPITSPRPMSVSMSEASIHISPTARVRRLLMTAAARALDDGRSEIDTADLLLALTRDKTTSPLLTDLGIDEAAMRTAIDRHPPPTDPPGTTGATGPSTPPHDPSNPEL